MFARVCFLRAQSNPNETLWLLAMGSSVNFLCEEFQANPMLLSSWNLLCDAASLAAERAFTGTSPGNSFSQLDNKSHRLLTEANLSSAEKSHQVLQRGHMLFYLLLRLWWLRWKSFYVAWNLFLTSLYVKCVEELLFSNLVTTREKLMSEESSKKLLSGESLRSYRIPRHVIS